LSFVGTLKSEKTINLAAESEGIIDSVSFQPGQVVSQGQILLVLRNMIQKSELDEAQAEYAITNDQYDRANKLYVQHLVSQADIKQIKYKLDEMRAKRDASLARYQQCFIRAPFSGQIGITQLSQGQYIKMGEKIVSLRSMPADYVDFNIPVVTKALIDQATHLVVMVLTDNKSSLTAKIIASDAIADENTRTLMYRAKLDKPTKDLMPGAYVSVKLAIDLNKSILLVPIDAVNYEPYGASVYLFNGGIAHLRYIKTAGVYNNFFIVSSGLAEGDEVILAEQAALHDGEAVTRATKPVSSGNIR
jgi:membrane fusion protein, multidrug efflux system